MHERTLFHVGGDVYTRDRHKAGTVKWVGPEYLQVQTGFLGMGAQPPAPEWGAMIAEARLYLPDAWWYATAPGLAIFVVVMVQILVFDAHR